MEHNSPTDLNEDLLEDIRNIKQILIEDIISRRERLAHARELADYLPAELAEEVRVTLRSELTLEEKANEIHLLEERLRSGRC